MSGLDIISALKKTGTNTLDVFTLLSDGLRPADQSKGWILAVVSDWHSSTLYYSFSPGCFPDSRVGFFFFCFFWPDVWFGVSWEEDRGSCPLSELHSERLTPSAPSLLELMSGGVCFSVVITSRPPSQSAQDVGVIWQLAAALQTQGHTNVCFFGGGGWWAHNLHTPTYMMSWPWLMMSVIQYECPVFCIYE